MMQPSVTGTATLVISPQQAPLFSINKKFTRRHSEKIKDTNIATNKISNIKHKGSLKNKRTFKPLVLPPQTQEKPIILLSNTGTQSLFNLARYEVNANSSNTHNQTDQIRLIFKDIEDLKIPRFLINVTSSAAATDNSTDQETQVSPHGNMHSTQTHQLQLNTHTPADEFSGKLKFRKNVKCKKPTKKSKLNSNGDSLTSSNSSVPKQMIITPTASIRSFSSSFDSTSSATALFSSSSSPSNSSSPSALLNFFNSSERRNSISSNSNKCQNLNFIPGESVDDVESMGTNLARSDEQENNSNKQDQTTNCIEQKGKKYRKSLPSNADFSKIITANSNGIVLDLNSNLINNHEAKIEEEEEEVNDDDGDDGLEIIDTNMKSALITKKLSINRSVPNLLKNMSEDSPLLLINNNDLHKHKSNETLTHTSKKSNNLFQDHKSNLELASQTKLLDTVINNRTNSSNSPVSYHCFTNLIVSSKKFSQRYKLLTEGDLQVCKLQHSRNVLSKLLNSKLLRRWKAHRIILTDTEIYSTTKTDYMDSSIPYHMITEINPISKWEPGQKYCLRVATIECHYLFQTNNIYVRDQWIHSILWKKHKFKSERVLRNAVRPEVLIREIKNMIDMSTTTPIDDTEISQHPLELVSEILQKHKLPRQTHEEVIVALSPLLEKNHPSPEICDFFSRHCRDSPRSHIVIEMFSPVVQRILKHNGDFGRYPRMRLFVQDYLMALVSQNGGLQTVQNFVMSMHSLSSQCPFPRVLPNFVSVCLASIHSCFENHWHKSLQPVVQLSLQEQEDQLVCHTTMMYTMSNFEDWRVNLAQLLQSVPFPDQALTHEKFIKIFKNVVKNFAQDSRCEVHQTLLGIREGKEGWFEIFCPGGVSCDDNGELFSIMLQTLIGCCCKKKRFLLSINKLLTTIMTLAAREVSCAIETLCAMLDLDGVENIENKLKIINTLQSTELGLKHYAKVCERQLQLKELQQKGGPRKLTLPSRSTDEDLAKLLLSGSFGNLECLSLAFTNVTSACAEYLIKLPSLRYLNLWSTKFGDQGLELISEHLQRLQVLNLCETPVTDKGLACLASMKQLRKLNLNSTNLSALTFEGLKECLPALQECDIRYTDAW